MVGGGVAALAPMSVSAHFGITGTADLIIDYGLLALIGILVVGGAAVSAWLAAGSPDEDEDGEVADWEHGEAVSTDRAGPAADPFDAPHSACGRQRPQRAVPLSRPPPLARLRSQLQGREETVPRAAGDRRGTGMTEWWHINAVPALETLTRGEPPQ